MNMKLRITLVFFLTFSLLIIVACSVHDEASGINTELTQEVATPTSQPESATAKLPAELIADTQPTIMQSSPISEPPEITITVNGQPVEYSFGLNIWDDAIVDREDILQIIMREDSDIPIPYIKLGGTIDIEFKGNPPTTVTLYDKVINTDGTSRYVEQVTKEFKLEITSGKLSCDFATNPAPFLSSYLADYEDGNTYRGFYLRCKWDNGNDCEYGFVVRTDAASII